VRLGVLEPKVRWWLFIFIRGYFELLHRRLAKHKKTLYDINHEQRYS
jgi:hypothetical protein